MCAQFFKRTRESVWDYPRPPKVEPTFRHLRVIFNDITVADTTRALRVLETSHPPAYYVPPEDVRMDLLHPSHQRTFCEYKGWATYWTIATGARRAEHAAWSYPEPTSEYEELKEHLAFYAGRVDACYVDDEQVVPQPGDFYGGWITSDLKGPFKGSSGTSRW